MTKDTVIDIISRAAKATNSQCIYAPGTCRECMGRYSIGGESTLKCIVTYFKHRESHPILFKNKMADLLKRGVLSEEDLLVILI